MLWGLVGLGWGCLLAAVLAPAAAASATTARLNLTYHDVFMMFLAPRFRDNKELAAVSSVPPCCCTVSVLWR